MESESDEDIAKRVINEALDNLRNNIIENIHPDYNILELFDNLRTNEHAEFEVLELVLELAHAFFRNDLTTFENLVITRRMSDEEIIEFLFTAEAKLHLWADVIRDFIYEIDWRVVHNFLGYNDRGYFVYTNNNIIVFNELNDKIQSLRRIVIDNERIKK